MPNVGPVVELQLKQQPFRVVTTYQTAVRAEGAGAVVTGSRTLAGYQGRDTAIRCDVFDAMEQAARARHAQKPEGALLALPFTPTQVAAARRYRALQESHDGAGLRGCLSSLTPRSGSGDVSAVDRGLDIARALQRMRRAAICTDPVVLSPSARLDMGTRHKLRLSDVFDAVVLADRSLSDVLKRAGWQPKEQLRRTLRDALRAALDRAAEA